MTYSHFLYWTANGDIPGFYATLRWPGWESDIAPLGADTGFSIYPPLWTNADTPISERSRKLVPMVELWGVQQDFARQIENLPDGSSIKLNVVD
jgi:hypothetical protein